jgi:hypothetical protein
MQVTNTTSFKLSVEDLKAIVQKEITNIHFVTDNDEVDVRFDIGNDPTWDGPGTSPVILGASVNVVRRNVGVHPSQASVFSGGKISEIKRGSTYRDGGSYDVTCMIDGTKHKFFRQCGYGADGQRGNRKLYLRANCPDLVKADVADPICEYLDRMGL